MAVFDQVPAAVRAAGDDDTAIAVAVAGDDVARRTGLIANVETIPGRDVNDAMLLALDHEGVDGRSGVGDQECGRQAGGRNENAEHGVLLGWGEDGSGQLNSG
jgi:hypothetical protein